MSRPPLSLAWENAIAGWVGHLTLRGLSPMTRQVQRDHVRYIARHSLTGGPEELTGRELAAMCAGMDWSADHRRGIRTSLLSFYGYCLTTGLATDNPAAALPKVKPPSPCPRPAPDDIWEALLAAAGPREQLMALLAGEAGLRRAEVAQVHRDDLLSGFSRPSLIVHGKGRKQRVVPINPVLAARIQGRCAELAAVPGWTGFVFPGHCDGHINVVYVGQLISALMPPGWSMHRLRTRFGTRAYRGSRNLRAVQVLLGHASVATTERYCAVDDDEIRAAAAGAWT